MKRGNGFGTIEITRDGKFRARRPGGKRETLAIFDTREEAERLLAGWNSAVYRGEIVEHTGITLAKFADDWFLRRELHGNKRAQKVRDVRSEVSLWGTHIEPSELAKKPLDSIRPIHVEDWLRWMSKRSAMRSVRGGESPRLVDTGRAVSTQTIKHALRILRQVLDDAVAREFIPSNPATSVSAPQSHGADAWTFLTASEIAKVHALSFGKGAPLLFAVYTGVRQAELWRMRWRDVDLSRKRFTVTGQTKSGKERVAPLLPAAVDVLRSHLATSKRTTPTDYVFGRLDGKPFATSYDAGWDDRKSRVGKDLVIKPGLRSLAGISRHVRFHDLRHTCASHLVTGTWGKPWRLEEVCSFLGHSSISVTQRYAHLVDGHLDRLAAETLQPGCPPLPAAPIVRIAQPAGITGAPAATRTQDLRLRRPLPPSQPVADDAPAGNMRATGELAAHILKSIATGGAVRSDIEALARAVMGRDDVRLAMEILGDSAAPHALRRAVELAAMVLDADPSTRSAVAEK